MIICLDFYFSHVEIYQYHESVNSMSARQIETLHISGYIEILLDDPFLGFVVVLKCLYFYHSVLIPEVKGKLRVL